MKPIASLRCLALWAEFGYDLLRAVSGQDDATLLDQVDELLKARIIEETRNGYRFCHTDSPGRVR